MCRVWRRSFLKFRLVISGGLRYTLTALKLANPALSYLAKQALLEIADTIQDLAVLLRVIFNYSSEFFHALGHLGHHAGLQLPELFLTTAFVIVIGIIA